MARIPAAKTDQKMIRYFLKGLFEVIAGCKYSNQFFKITQRNTWRKKSVAQRRIT
jgi:hypothetical protein